jgi:hypothetical protein
MNSWVNDLIIKKVEKSLNRSGQEGSDKKKESRKPSSGGPSSKLIKATMMMLVIGMAMTYPRLKINLQRLQDDWICLWVIDFYCRQ